MQKQSVSSPVEEVSFIKGYLYQIYPTTDQLELLNKSFGCCRHVYNLALEQAIAEYQHYLATKDLPTIGTAVRPSITGFSFCSKLTAIKADPTKPWLYDVPAVALQQSMLNLGDAFSHFFKNKMGYPRFKSKYDTQSITLTGTAFKVENGFLYIAKCKTPIAVGWSRDLPSIPTTCTITKLPSGKITVAFTCKYTPTKTSGTGIIGIDLGLTDFLVTSEGDKVPNPRYLRKYQRELRRRQQALSKKQKGSKNREKARIKVAEKHEQIANCRNDFQHKLSRKLTDENQVIGLEKLVVKNMVKNSKLSKAISDAGWSGFTSKLNYKAKESQHCSLVYMDTWYPSSHICSSCDTQLDRKLSLKEREWKCPQCGTIHDRDINAAINIGHEAITQIELFGIGDNTSVILVANSKH